MNLAIIEIYLLLSTTVFVLFLGLFVYLRNRDVLLNKMFCIFSLNIALWAFIVIMLLVNRNDQRMLTWAPLTYAVAFFLPPNFMLFAFTLSQKQLTYRYKIIIPYLLAGVMCIVALSPLHIKGYRIDATGEMDVIYGNALPLFLAYFTLLMGWTLYYLYSRIVYYSGMKRLQFQYLFFGTAIFTILAICTGLIAPLLRLTSNELASLSPCFALIWVGFVAYAIGKYRLMDIAIVIKSTTMYALLTACITAGYVCVVLLTSWLFGGMRGLQSLIAAMISAFLIAFAFIPLKEAIQTFIDKILFKNRYDHRKILGNLSKALTSIININELLAHIIMIITKAMDITAGAFYLPEASGNAYVPRATQGNIDAMASYEAIPTNCALIRELIRKRELIIREQLERLPQTLETRDVVEFLKRIKAEICIPVYSKNALTGILFFGRKETRETFTSEDIEMFTTLSYHIAIAIENSQLYTKAEESKRYQDILMNSLTSGVIAVDLNSRITAFNRRAEAIIGIPASETITEIISILPAELRAVLMDTLAHEESANTTEVVLKSNGSKEVPLAVSSSIFKNNEGKPLGALIAFSDLTEKKVLEAEIRRADRLASLGTLAAGIAHEIKNPLVSLKIFTRLLPQNYRDKKFREEFSTIANEEIDRINGFVEQLLDFARPRSPLMKQIDVCDIVRNTLLLLNNKIKEQRIEVRAEIGAEPLLVMADGNQLKQVLVNIITNALQAIQDSGVLIVRVDLVKQQGYFPEAIRAEGIAEEQARLKSGDNVVIEITDTGKGIDEKDILHLFEPFFTTKEAGVGLGLAIAHSIIEEHSGAIDVKSKVGEGTTFSIMLPLVPKGVRVVQMENLAV
ncbi:MAG: ATP-binding protein [Candidatus Aureabacteria bacterium]|nr:ATP-binding protein [Candidatus Auribacterota bacterium]